MFKSTYIFSMMLLLTFILQLRADDSLAPKSGKLVESITEHVRFLASDELEGRGVETEGNTRGNRF